MPSSRDNPLFESIVMGSDSWGDAMSAMFAVCDYMWTHYPDAIPSEWEYRASPMLERGKPDALETDDYPLCEVIATAPSEEECVHAGKVLHRYTQWLRDHGMSY